MNNEEPIKNLVALLSVGGLAKSPMDAPSILAGPVSSACGDLAMPLDDPLPTFEHQAVCGAPPF